jgi:hypothetical protein
MLHGTLPLGPRLMNLRPLPFALWGSRPLAVLRLAACPLIVMAGLFALGWTPNLLEGVRLRLLA